MDGSGGNVVGAAEGKETQLLKKGKKDPTIGTHKIDTDENSWVATNQPSQLKIKAYINLHHFKIRVLQSASLLEIVEQNRALISTGY